MDWFENLTGFRERDAGHIRENLIVADGRLRSMVNGRAHGIGTLEVTSLRDLRAQAAGIGARMPGKLRLCAISGDVRRMHRDPAFANALFQVASQFNLLEMTSPMITPDQGVTRYESDATQGPACAIAAGVATIYRNYFVPLDGALGQTAKRQIDCLRAVGQALDNSGNRLWTMRNGYALCTAAGLAAIRAHLASLDETGLDDLREKLSIGLHWNVEVTDDVAGPPPFVSQAFCSALPVAYGEPDSAAWEPFATLILEAAYEATIWAAILNANARGSNVVLLTRLGGGAFGNEKEWIHHAMTRALRLVRDVALDVRIVCYGKPDAELESLVAAFQ